MVHRRWVLSQGVLHQLHLLLLLSFEILQLQPKLEMVYLKQIMLFTIFEQLDNVLDNPGEAFGVYICQFGQGGESHFKHFFGITNFHSLIVFFHAPSNSLPLLPQLLSGEGVPRDGAIWKFLLQDVQQLLANVQGNGKSLTVAMRETTNL